MKRNVPTRDIVTETFGPLARLPSGFGTSPRHPIDPRLAEILRDEDRRQPWPSEWRRYWEERAEAERRRRDGSS